MEEDRRCNTCIHYDPDSGVCEKTGEKRFTFDGKECDRWIDWEYEFYRGKKHEKNHKA